jgi:hypothetical protein
MSFNPQIALQIDFAAAAIAVIALLISLWVSRRQSRLDLEHLRMQRDNDVIGWSNRSLEAFCAAEMLLHQDYLASSSKSDYERLRLSIMRDLSVCIDQGRLYFPNIDKNKYGLHKESAFQGIRHLVLDCLVWTYDVLRNESGYEKVDDLEGRRGEITKYKREFISEVQSEVDPVRRVSFLKSHRV